MASCAPNFRDSNCQQYSYAMIVVERISVMRPGYMHNACGSVIRKTVGECELCI